MFFTFDRRKRLAMAAALSAAVCGPTAVSDANVVQGTNGTDGTSEAGESVTASNPPSADNTQYAYGGNGGAGRNATQEVWASTPGGPGGNANASILAIDPSTGLPNVLPSFAYAYAQGGNGGAGGMGLLTQTINSAGGMGGSGGAATGISNAKSSTDGASAYLELKGGDGGDGGVVDGPVSPAGYGGDGAHVAAGVGANTLPTAYVPMLPRLAPMPRALRLMPRSASPEVTEEHPFLT